MATVSLVLSTCDTKSASGGGMPVAKSQPKGKTSITSSASTQPVPIAGVTAARKSDVWVVTSAGGAVWVKFGSNPTASAGNDWYIPAGVPQAFGVSVDGETMAVIDAS